MRTHPGIGDIILPALAAIAADEDGRNRLVEQLRGNPPWRTWFLRNLPKAAEPTVAYAILGALSSDGLVVADNEIAPFLNRLIDSGSFGLAYLAWRRLRPGEADGPLLANGDFNEPAGEVPFGWILSAKPGSKTEIADAHQPERGRALHVTFANTRVAYSDVRTLLLLHPGQYRLSGLVRLDELASERGMVWRVYCADGDKQIIAETERFSGKSPWQSFGMNFVVPEANCSAQWLKLEHAARFALEQQISGEIWFDHMAIERREAVTAAN